MPVAAPVSPGPLVVDVRRAAREAAARVTDAALGRASGAARRVTITAGSRSFTGLAAVTSELVTALRARGWEPILVPAMGSHGGATAAGRRQILAGAGITEAAIGVPIVDGSAMVELGRSPGGRHVFCHPAALASDAVLLVNRVKSHNAFEGRVGSGLLKMLAVGLGGPEGAVEVHRRGAAGMEEAILDLAGSLARRLPLAGAIATVENAAGAVAAIVPVVGGAEVVGRTDSACLALGRSLEPRLPVMSLDLLLVDRMGKDVSGPGMDPKVVGRRGVWDYPDPPEPRVKRVVVFRLTPGSAGNANGVGLADFTTRRLAGSIDWPETMRNVEATTFTLRARLPAVFPTDREAVRAALASLYLDDWQAARVVRLSDTRHLDRYWVSEALLAAEPGLWKPLGRPASLPFGPDGDLTDLD